MKKINRNIPNQSQFLFTYSYLESQKMLISEAATGGVLCEKVLLENSQNSQENTCARVSF